MKAAVMACVVVALVVAGEVAGTDEGGKGVSGDKSAPEDRLQQDRRGVRLFALSTTTSIKRVATTTITAINTCLSVIAGTTCTGRRKRALFSDLDALEGIEDQAYALHGTQRDEKEVKTEASEGHTAGVEEEQEEEERLQKRELDGRSGRKITIYSSFISTLTLTSTSYLAGTTVTATALCVAPGLTTGCFGK
ncbi:uncharacterized protein LOC123512880 [Portunus trituberculatus]|uniref:uncharacterized protein LOC123512880 n=1 Tax=Portunus trituberculatus TaxID=210409 RepID=UPI001E1CE4FC|nr:uncharacterized protein LOC123512880 [Portunus trituberculatus]